TADGVQALATPPRSALVLGGDAAGTGFGLEYAALLAAAGSAVTVVTPDDRLVPGLDADVSSAAAALLGDLGISALCGWSVAGGDGDAVTVRRGEEQRHVDAEVVVAADVRRPYFGGLNLDAAGVKTTDRIAVDRACRTNVPHIYAAGDVTGGVMLT